MKLMFGGEVVLCATYIRNCCPCYVTNNTTPYELWYDKLPTVQHFRVLGSKCYALIPKQQRNKLGARSWKCIFLVILILPKHTKIYDEEAYKFNLSRDVIFLQ